MIKHIVLFKFNKIHASPEVTELHRRFTQLPSLIPEILHFESGDDVSVENIHHGFTKVYVLTFKGPEERDKYLAHPDHVAFTELAAPLFDDVLSFDYQPDEN